METRRFIVVVSCITALFCVLTVVYNFSSEPPFGAATAAASQSVSTDFYSLFEDSSSVLSESASSRDSGTESSGSAASRSKKTASSAASKSASSYVSKGVPSSAVNINTASLEKLETLPGIGEVLAQRILDYRKQHGRFQSVEDLDNVKGIGDKTIAKLKKYVTLK